MSEAADCRGPFCFDVHGHLSKGRARLTILVPGAVLAGGLLMRPDPGGAPGQPAGGEDQALHIATIARLHAGESYYVVVGDKLRRRGYPTASVFNWRTPALVRALAFNPVLGRVAFVL